VRGHCTPYKFKDMDVVKVLQMIETNFLAIWFCSASVILFNNLLSNTELNTIYLCSVSIRVPYCKVDRNDNMS